MRFRTIVSIAFLTFLAGCMLPRNVVVALPDEDGQIGRVSVGNASGVTELTRALAAVALQPGEPPGQPFLTDQQAIKSVFEKVLEATPRKPAVFVIYFEPGSTRVAVVSQGDLARAMQLAGTLAHPEISIATHSDSVSPVGHDEVLMESRARLVADAMVRAGVSPSVIEIENFGTAIPLAARPGAPPPSNTRIEVTIR